MEALKNVVSTVKSHPITAAAVAVLAYIGAKKYAKLENKYALVAVAVVAGIAGATVQSKMKAKASAPTAQLAAKA